MPSLPDCEVLWKIAAVSEIDKWKSTGKFTLESPLDKSDGFFHCSNSLRITKTAQLYFKGKGGFKMVKIMPKKWIERRRVRLVDEAPRQ